MKNQRTMKATGMRVGFVSLRTIRHLFHGQFCIETPEYLALEEEVMRDESDPVYDKINRIRDYQNVVSDFNKAFEQYQLEHAE